MQVPTENDRPPSYLWAQHNGAKRQTERKRTLILRSTSSQGQNTIFNSDLTEWRVALYSVFEGTRTPFPSVLADGQVDRREVPNVGITDIHLDVSDVTSRHFLDGALATLNRSVKLDAVEADLFVPASWAFVANAVVYDFRRTRAGHEMFTRRVLCVHARGHSTRRCTYFEPGGCS